VRPVSPTPPLEALPLTCLFLFTTNSKGREKAILEMDLKIDDLLEKVRTVSSLPISEVGAPVA
jgi:hypothetical protein